MQPVDIKSQFFLQGQYGDYMLYPATAENTARFLEPCLDKVSADEIIETWLLCHISVQDILEKTLSLVRQGIGEAYFLVLEKNGQQNVIGIGGIMPIPSMTGNVSQDAAPSVMDIGNNTSTGCASLAERAQRKPRFSQARASGQQDAAPSVICKGEIWFAGEHLSSHKRFLVRHGKELIQKALTRYCVLKNKAGAWNYQAFYLAEYLGFHVSKSPIRAGMDNALFREFCITASITDNQ